MTTAQVVETSVTVNNNSPIQDYVHPDDQTQPFEKKEIKVIAAMVNWSGRMLGNRLYIKEMSACSVWM